MLAALPTLPVDNGDQKQVNSSNDDKLGPISRLSHDHDHRTLKPKDTNFLQSA